MPSNERLRRALRPLAVVLGAGILWNAATVAAVAQAPPVLDIDRAFAPASGIARDGEPGTGTDIPGGVAVFGDRIYTAGESNGDVAVVARRATGGLDAGFAGDGRIDIALGNGKDVATSIVVLPDGRLRILASTDADPSPSATNTDVALIGLNADGTDDASFGGGDGRLSFPVGPIDDLPTRMAADAGGRLALIGYRKDVNGKEDTWVSLRRPDGSPEPSFDGDGIRVLDRAGELRNDRGTDVAFAPGGGLVALLQVATSADTNVNNYIAALHAFRSDGAEDGAFSGDGDLVLDVGDPNTIPGGLLVHGNRFWATGSTKVGDDTDAFLARVAADGSGFQFRRFDMRGFQIAATERLVSGGGDLDVLPGSPNTLVVVGSTTYNSRTYWSAAAFTGIEGDLDRALYGDLLIPTEEYGALLGVAAGNGWLAATGSLLNVNGNFDTSFGTIRLLTGTSLAPPATVACDLAIDVPLPLEIVARGSAPVGVQLRVTNRGTTTCGGVVSVPAPYVLRAGSASGSLPTGPIAPGATWTASAEISYTGSRRREDALSFELSSAADDDLRNNKKVVHVRFPYCDVHVRPVGERVRLPTEGRARLELAVGNAGTEACRDVRLTVDRPWRIVRRAPGYTLAAGRSVSDVITVEALGRVPKRTRLRVAVRAAGDVADADAGDAVALVPSLIPVGDSSIRAAGARRISGAASAGRAARLSRGRLRVARVDVAVMRRSGRSCSWLRSATGRFRRGACDAPVWLRARGTTRWSYALRRALPRDGYVAYSRAVLAAGFAEGAFDAKDRNRRGFRVP